MKILKQQGERTHLRNKLNPYYYTDRAEELLRVTTREERVAWMQHPCTQSILLSLEGDIAGELLVWIEGGYSSENSIDTTAQNQAKVRGMIQAANDIREHIESIVDFEED